MNEKQYNRLSVEQKERIRLYLLGEPRTLKPGLSPAEFPRQFDVYVYEFDPNPPHVPVKTYAGVEITSGRFFRIVNFSHQVLGSAYFNHDRYGIFGPPKTVSSLRLSNLKLTKTQYEEFLSDLADIIHSIDPDVQIEWDGISFSRTGPLITPI